MRKNRKKPLCYPEEGGGEVENTFLNILRKIKSYVLDGVLRIRNCLIQIRGSGSGQQYVTNPDSDPDTNPDSYIGFESVSGS